MGFVNQENRFSECLISSVECNTANQKKKEELKAKCNDSFYKCQLQINK